MESAGSGHVSDETSVVTEDNLFSTSSVTRKRKISKMWETMYGGALGLNNDGGGALFGGGHSTLFVSTMGATSSARIHELHDPRQPQKELRKDSTTKMAQWRVDEIDGNLAADFDDSLSGLGVELGTASYNMSEALMALPILPAFKQEPDPENGCQHGNSTTAQSSTGGASPHPHGPLLMPSPSGSVTSVGGGSGSGGSIGVGNGVGNGGTSVSSAGPNPSSPYCVGNSGLSQNRFQYVLGAATSIATKMHEETLTYLNQGQSYEIKLKKLGDLAEFRGKLLKSIVRVCFHERRLQYMEKEQIASWKHTRPGERILDIDIPLSYGICDIVQDLSMLNVCEFAWDPTKETGVFIRVNCISTEFTPKKHGGEKGVPFRIQIETYTHGDGPAQRLHCASCQVKVFKPKGADRKHKTDREKMEKRTASDQVTCGDKFQPSYDCTVLTECLLDSIYSSPAPSVAVSVSSSMPPQKADSIIYSPTPSEQPPGTPTSLTAESPVMGSVDTLDNTAFDFLHMYQQPLSTDASSAQTCQWLQAHRFGNYVRTFASFSGADIMRLSREDLIQICSLTDGIRLYNALHSRNIRPRLTIYVCLEPDQGSLDCVYHALYLENLSVEELIGKLAQLINVQTQNVHDVYIQGPSGIHVLMNDEVIRNLREESMFIVEVLRDQTSYRLLLKSSTVQ